MDSTGVPMPATYELSTDFIKPTGAWTTTVPVVLAGTPLIYTTDTTVGLNVQDALDWNLAHQMRTTNSLMPDALQRLLFGRVGPSFGNVFYLTFSATIIDIELSFLDNFTSAGDFLGSATGSVPVLKFSSGANFGGSSRELRLVFKQTGTYRMAFRLIDNVGAGNWTVFQVDFVVVK